MNLSTRVILVCEQLQEAQAQDADPVEYHHRANYRYGLRCPACGRLLHRVSHLPARRRCRGCRKPWMIQGRDSGVHYTVGDIYQLYMNRATGQPAEPLAVE